MIEVNSKKVNYNQSNFVIHKNISLEKDLDCFIILASENKNFGELVLNNALEFIIDKISIVNTYKDLSTALENINAIIKTWKKDTAKEVSLDMIIGVLHENNFMFSNIGSASCFLVNKEKDVIELTENDENKTNFNFISNGTLSNNENVILSNSRILNYLSITDLLDGVNNDYNLKFFSENIHEILLSEKLEHNISITNLKYNSGVTITSTNPYKEKTKEYCLKFAEKKYVAKTLAFGLVLKDKIIKQSKQVKNLLFLAGITISLFVLYSILGSVVQISTQSEDKELAKNNVAQVKNFLSIASENINNETAFENNILKAEKIIGELESTGLFVNDIQKINDTINIIKKQFNKIETFSATTENTLYSGNFSEGVKILKNNLKPYIITKKGITGPILPNTEVKKYSFNSLEKNEIFIDATEIGDNIYLLTSLSKIVEFSKNGHFKFMDVNGQQKWEQAISIDSYGQNIYLLGKDENQIFKHSLVGKTFNKANSYLKDEDISQIGGIESLAIDGGFYILKKDLSIIKFFSSPKYRLEKLMINKRPGNYDKEENSKIELKARNDLNYVYMLLNNKIWVFQPNTKLYTDTKALTYIGQIEGEKNNIIDFYINHDGELSVLDKTGLYKLNFETSDDKLLIR